MIPPLSEEITDKGERDRLIAENERLRTALQDIAFSEQCEYTTLDSYSIGVVDGHRRCANLARRALGLKEGT